MALAVGSGCSALVYEVVWLQQLELIIGSSAVSLGLLLATYMGGLFLGSTACARFVPATIYPLRLYAILELGTAALGLLILSALPYAGTLYFFSAREGVPNLLLRGSLSAICLLPPTILMGATLPVLSRLLERAPDAASWVGLFYAGNLGGAVFGALLAGFYLLRVYDLAAATYVAVGVNLAVASAGFGLAAARKQCPTISEPRVNTRVRIPGAASIYTAIALSGLSALGAQVVWTRLLSILFGTTVYSFSIIVAVFLLGLGLGSGIGSLLSARARYPRLLFGMCQATLAICIASTAWAIARWLPYWPIDPSLAQSPWFNFQLDLFRTVWTILPATVLWGASFPLALASLSTSQDDIDRLTALVYGANTLGAIAGALMFTFVFVPRIGTMHSEQILVLTACVAALILLISLLRASATNQSDRERRLSWEQAAGLAIAVVFGLGLIGTVSDVPWQLIAYGRRVALMMYADREQEKAHPLKLLYRGEGMDSSLVITDQSDLRIIYVNGNAEASNAADDIRFERMAGHLPALVCANPRDVLIVGFGAGVTAGSFVPYPDVKRIVIAELESLIPPASGQFFRQSNYGVLNDPRTNVVHDDGRHYLLTHEDRFDVITSDPVHLWVKGTSALYSKEYFEVVRRRLKPGGVIAQWLPLYDGDADTIKSVLATFFEVFPDGTIWSNHTENRGFDLLLLGGAGPNSLNVDQVQQRLDQPDYSAVARSLGAIGWPSAIDILSTYLGQASDLKPWLWGAQRNSDRNLRLQYLAGLEINSHASEEIFQTLLSYRRFPKFFSGSDRSMQALKSFLMPAH